MGIPSYFSHIVRQHRKIIKPINFNDSPKINNLYLDCNSFIYDAHRDLTNKGETLKIKTDKDIKNYESSIIKCVCDSLIKFIHQLKPNKRLFIAFDGVAPMAKLNQQRNRRYMSAFQSSLDGDKVDTYKWNTSAITPGTDFMYELGLTISKRFINPSEFNLEAVIVSASDEHGEGEHKIYEYIRADAAYHKDTYTVIYGLDADLIMLTLNHLHISENMYLFRETPEFIKNIDKTLNPNETYLLDIPLFARTIINELSIGDDAKQPADIERISLKNDVLFDYIFLCFFLGNDFLPHFPALNIRTNGINRLIDGYKFVFTKKGDTLTQDRVIVWKNVWKLIDYLAKNELTYIKEEYVHREKLSKRTLYEERGKMMSKTYFDENLLLPVKERPIEIYINPDEAGWETRYYKGLFHSKIDDNKRKEISLNYLEGLEWTMKYYSSGCADWRWTYNYHYPPLLCDLIKHVPYFPTEFVPLQKENPVSPLVQLSYVLPPSSMDLLPPTLRIKLLKEEPGWYVGNYVFLWSFCKFFWEAHVDLPNIDIERLEMVVSGTT
jgi:5'-3' exoribonuclease 1